MTSRPIRVLLPVLGLSAALGLGSASAQDARPEPVDLTNLKDFLAKAKRAGYASGDESRFQKLEDGGTDVQISEGDLLYRDRWYGGTSFTGQEIVWLRGRAVWSLNFYGANRPGTSAPPEDFTRFHKAALRRVEAESPYRGPQIYSDGRFVYVSEVAGSIERFQGVERVFYDDVEVFRLDFHGGLTDR